MSDVSAPSNVRTLSGPVRWLLQGLAGLCLLLALVGVVLPVMPTVPFLLVAAWAASRSSPRLHHWLRTHPRFGRPLRDWEEAGLVPRGAKWLATLMMCASAGCLLVIAPQGWMPAASGAVVGMCVVLAWLWRRPERPPGRA
jgi:hypothetical protein